jgi:Zn ribbon nucleic-acid-binding protein
MGMNEDERNKSALQSWKEQSMETNQVKCDHDCRITCSMLIESMRKEADMIRFYESLMAECDYPDVNSFVRELLEEKSRIVLRMNQKLNEIRVRGQVSKGIISSFEPDEI